MSSFTSTSSMDSGSESWASGDEDVASSPSSATLYAVLGVDITASQERIKLAYRQLARRYHPDRNQGNPEAVRKFQTIQNAYEVLSDDERRKDYDLNLLDQLDVEDYLSRFQGFILTVCGLGMSSRGGSYALQESSGQPHPPMLALLMA